MKAASRIIIQIYYLLLLRVCMRLFKQVSLIGMLKVCKTNLSVTEHGINSTFMISN